MTATQASINVAPGSVVVVRDEEWIVQETSQSADGVLVRARGLGELVRDTTATFYSSLDRIEPLDPSAATVVADDSPHYRKARLWLESTFRRTAVPLADPDLTVAGQMLADPLVYQQSAVRKALDPDNLRPRILLADAVGLGKTLEIGMILAELVRRGRGERILVVTPRHVLEQMQHELWTRFALPFVRLDSAGIQRVRQKLPATRNPFTYYKRVIISIDTLKSDQYIANLRKHRWDAVVIDESHNVTNTATQNNKLARLLSRQTEALILASATPHNGKRESFAELIRLLDPSAVPPDGTLPEGAVKRLVIRRHRHSPEVAGVVGADWAERQEPNNILIEAADAENAVADELADTWLFPGPGGNPYSGKTSTLFPWTLAKAFLSSPAALTESIRERRRRLGTGSAADIERDALDRLAGLTDAVVPGSSAKYRALLDHARDIGVGPKSAARVVVFAERVATLKWLQQTLPNDLGLPADAVALLHGGLTDDEQQRVVEDFKQEHSPVRVLVTGDVASEGVNLHRQCHELVHYDIPWSLIRIEQRNGRIDRYGQLHPPRVTALLLAPSHERFGGDLRILSRLMEREHEAHGALGDVASLMGKHDVGSEEDEIRAVLAGTKQWDDVVRTVDEVAASDDLEGLFFRLFDAPDDTANAPVEASTPTAAPTERTTGLYDAPVDFLDDALHAVFPDPSAQVGRGGVAWRNDPTFGTAELLPPPDLAQRLEVLPQSYLADRHITERLVLATTTTRGQQRLGAALADDTSTSWPDAHFLGPLHPVLDWAADRALASLGRNEVFAVRGAVDHPTVLLLGTLTNKRGHIVSATWPTVEFAGSLDVAPVTLHASLRDALSALGWTSGRANPGPVDVIDLQRLIAPAVRLAGGHLGLVMDAARGAITGRVQQWSQRLADWTDEADALIQRRELQTARAAVEQERGYTDAMNPDRQLVRPLLVVVPERQGA